MYVLNHRAAILEPKGPISKKMGSEMDPNLEQNPKHRINNSQRGRCWGSLGALGGSLALLGVSWGAPGGLWVLWGVLLALLGCFGCSGVLFGTSECALAVVFCLPWKRHFSKIPFLNVSGPM